MTVADRFEIDGDADRFVLKVQEEIGELNQPYLVLSGQARRKNRSPRRPPAVFRAEVADVLCHVLVLAHHHKIDVVEEVCEEVCKKWLVFAGDVRTGPDRTGPDREESLSVTRSQNVATA